MSLYILRNNTVERSVIFDFLSMLAYVVSVTLRLWSV